ncbi:tetratricopeptide repeat protein [Pontibacter sp. G13]|uniref:tetratricopeptide repeat protein n=1 Tax=Pontibacter sp. G13 TaxID=3074898 RepID=UPI002889045B|nr:tetratricopeptide repeat protein [Pontibacter sp. G13]WNJ17511.1 tetratricopeptide repeat protein [Pontibacter sp. G13]
MRSSTPRKTARWLDRVYAFAVRYFQYADHGEGARYFREGQQLQDEENHEAAIFALSQAISCDPNYVDAWVLRGISHLRLEAFESAITDFSEAIELDPSEEVAFFNRGLSHWKEDRPVDAVSDYTEAIEINPDYPSAYVNRGLAFLQLGEYRPAIGDLSIALKFIPDHPDILIARAEAFLHLGNLPNSRRDLEQVLAFHPETAKLFASLAHLEWLEGNSDQAIVAWTRAIRLDDSVKEYYCRRGDAFRTKSKFQLALEDYEMALLLDPDCPDALGGMAMVEAQNGDPEAFLERLRMALEVGFQVWNAQHWHDPILDPFRSHPELWGLIDRYRTQQS